MKRKVKGFTLVELLVVMAIFGIIMFGALQLIPPVMKMMVQADVHESGNAAVSSISGYLESELSTAEYLYASNVLPATTSVGVNEIELADKKLVRDFVTQFYEGVLKNGATATSPDYGNGKVHVLLIDNTQNGKISEIVYKVRDFEIGITDSDLIYESSTEYAVNKAYYDNYNFEIMCGTYDESSFDLTDPVSYQDFLNNLSSRNTAFSIRATTHRNNTDYSFVTNSTMSLVNIFNNPTGVPGVYYGITEVYDPGTQTLTPYIVDITNGYNEDGFSKYMSKYKMNEYDALNNHYYDLKNSRHEGLLGTSKIIDHTIGATDGYCFIYSYGSEIDTQ